MRERTRLARFVPLLAAGVFLLSGCVKFQGDMSVNSDATANGSFTVEVAQSAAALMGLTSGDALAEQVNAGKFGGGSSAADISCKSIDRSGAIAAECTFSNVPFTDTGSLWNIQRNGDDVVLVVENHQKEGEDQSSNPFTVGIPQDSISLTFTMPGDIKSIQGDKASKVNPRTAHVSASILDDFRVVITSAAGGGGLATSAVILIAVGALLAAIAFIVVILVIARRRKSLSDASASSPEMSDQSQPAPPTA